MTMAINFDEIRSAKTAAEAAAAWWVAALRDPKQDNGTSNPKTLLLSAMARMSAPPWPEGILKRFAELLKEELDAQSSSYGVILRVDYHPEDLLLQCAEAAGIGDSIISWPWKTCMWVTPDKVSVRYGYAAAKEVIWQA